MYTNLVALTTTERALRFTRVNNWSFAARESIVPIGLAEAQALAEEYALVFSHEQDGPGYLAALLGSQGVNRYVNEQHQWLAQQIPARLRLYPFALAQGESADRFIVARDADAPHFKDENGEKLIDDEGRAVQLIEQVTVALFELRQSQEQARALSGELEAAGLIDDRSIAIKLKDGREHSFNGFKAVNEEKLAALKPKQREKLEKSGALELLALHQKSLKNIARLVP